MYVAVVGPGADATPAECDQGREVGRLLAEHGAVVVTGGLAGVMAAAAEGCAQAGGRSVGLLPGRDRAAASPHLTVAVPTGLGELRNGVVVHSCDGMIAIGGSWGTLSEIALARRTDRPVVTLGGWSVRDADGATVPMVVASSPQDAVARCLALVTAPPHRS
jgi:uncharacterized protein (TIGR00725 family)